MSEGPTPPLTLPGGRFVVQAHDAPPLHYDLMLEQDGALATFGLAQPPESAAPQAADPKPAHRLEYLEYEGPISEGRGTTAIWDRGTYRTEAATDGVLRIELQGERARGWFRLEAAEGRPMWIPETSAPPPTSPATAPRRRRAAPGGGRPVRRGTPPIVRVLQVLAVCVLAGGIAYGVALSRYRAEYRTQTYIRVLQLYQNLLEEKDELRFNDRVQKFEERVLGQPAMVIGRIGAIEPATRTASHPDGPALFLWVNVPNMIEEADSTPLDVRCTIAAAAVELPTEPGAAGHRHRWRYGDLIVVEGILERFSVDLTATHATVVIKDAHARDPGVLEARFYSEEARSLGTLEPLKGITDPLRDQRK